MPLSPRRLRRLSPSMVALAPAAEVAVATSTPLPAVRSCRSSLATSDRPKAEASEPPVMTVRQEALGLLDLTLHGSETLRR